MQCTERQNDYGMTNIGRFTGKIEYQVKTWGIAVANYPLHWLPLPNTAQLGRHSTRRLYRWDLPQLHQYWRSLYLEEDLKLPLCQLNGIKTTLQSGRRVYKHWQTVFLRHVFCRVISSRPGYDNLMSGLVLILASSLYGELKLSWREGGDGWPGR